MNILIDTDAIKDTSFAFFCSPSSVSILMLVTLYSQDGCCNFRDHFKAGFKAGRSGFKAGRRSEEAWYQANHAFSPENAKKEQRPSEKLFRRLSLHLFGQGNGVRWHPLVMGEPWKWAQCDPNRNLEEGRNDVCMPPQGHHRGKSPFVQNKRNTGYRNEAKLQWD